MYISDTNIEPYNSLDNLFVDNSIEINEVSGTDTYEHEDILYLIVENGIHTTLELRVESENSSGSSLYISPVDVIGDPTHWGKLITLTDIDASDELQIIQFRDKWVVINNIYIIKRTQVSGIINIYEV